MAHFGDTFRRLIRERHFSLSAFAEHSKLSDSVITRAVKWAAFAGSPTTYRAMAQALGMTPEQLDAAWKEEAADSAAPATQPPQQEKTMNPITVDQIRALDLEACQIAQAAIAQRIEQLARPAGRSVKGGRTAS